MKTTAYLNNQPVEIIATENRHEVWVETTDGRVLRVFKRGLTTASSTPVAISDLRVDPTRGTDGAR